MTSLEDAYMAYKYPTKTHEIQLDIENDHMFTITTLATHKRINGVEIYQRKDEFPNVSLIRAGYLGCTPVDPPLAFSLDTLELYYRLKRRHPRLSIQAMVCALADLHNVSLFISTSL